ncbi:MAG TPA: hypothetical protein VGQ62_17180 [Chloroflexota bacterium]|jgi:hypothetical protein|nr:hypothetical protein [Chloroflexota bacterium]
MIDVHDVSIVTGPIPLPDAVAAGYTSVEALLADLKGPADAVLYRVELQRSPEPDARAVLADGALLTQPEVGELQAKLARLDATRVWTRATLEAIEARPATRAGDLAADLGWPELAVFKLQVRKLKALGLTLSLEVGYRLAPRGEAYLRAIRAAGLTSAADRPIVLTL